MNNALICIGFKYEIKSLLKFCYVNIIKRAFDLVMAIAILILCMVPMIFVAIFIKIEDGGPIIYKSKRMGKNCKIFNVYKFRTMKTNREELKSKMTHDEMITKVGKILRKTSIDELPQIFNILKGEMSFIGPRPWILEYYECFTQRDKIRTDVLPGISGLAQVKGRNGIDIFSKINYDLEYVEKVSFLFDIKIVILTIITVFKKDNAEISEKGIVNEINDLKIRNGINII